jgi:hypothetical protein
VRERGDGCARIGAQQPDQPPVEGIHRAAPAAVRPGSKQSFWQLNKSC